MSNEQLDNRLGAAIKATRQAKGWTQSYLAGLLKITPRYLKALENSGRKPSYDLFVRIIRELEISADTIFYPENERFPAKLYILQSGRNRN